MAISKISNVVFPFTECKGTWKLFWFLFLKPEKIQFPFRIPEILISILKTRKISIFIASKIIPEFYFMEKFSKSFHFLNEFFSLNNANPSNKRLRQKKKRPADAFEPDLEEPSSSLGRSQAGAPILLENKNLNLHIRLRFISFT